MKLQVSLALVAWSLPIALTLPGSAAAKDPFAEMDEAFERSEAASPAKEAEEFQRFRNQYLSDYQAYKQALLAEFEQYKAIVREETQKLQDELAQYWDEPELSSKTVWVEYSADKRERTRVDFERQRIDVELPTANPNPDEVREKIKRLLQKDKREAFKNDAWAQAIENRASREVAFLQTAEVRPESILAPSIIGKSQFSDRELEQAVTQMLQNKTVTQTTTHSGATITKVSLPLITLPASPTEQVPAQNEALKPDSRRTVETRPAPRAQKVPLQAQALLAHVSQQAEKRQLDSALILAVIETESAFNPMARSPVPAYGLMQIVPQSAGLDVTRIMFGKEKILAPSYLYNSENNIEVGAAYLNLLYYRYLNQIEDPLSRLYCAVAAYNTGAGNVARAFTGGPMRVSAARDKINGMSPQQVYDHLRANLPYAETQEYLKRVVERIDKYETI